MSDYAHELSPTSPGQQFGPPPDVVRCSLCTTVLDFGADRCPSCGLWKGGHGETVSRSTLLRVSAVFAALYGIAILVVALAR